MESCIFAARNPKIYKIVSEVDIKFNLQSVQRYLAAKSGCVGIIITFIFFCLGVF